MSDDTAAKSGSCLCGAVRYRVTGSLKPVVACHCSLCRRQTSHFLAFTAAWNDQLAIEDDGALAWFRSGDRSQRGFCSRCGSMLFFVTDGDDKTSISAGSIDGATGLSIAAHIFVADKGDYYALNDGCPQHPAGGDGIPMPSRS